MGLGNRTAAQHDTVSVRKVGMDTSVYQSFHVGQPVMTIDNAAGQVTAVWDGPVPGYEEYHVTLDNGLGAGQYTAGQLTAVGTPVTSSEHHLASDDYPEMGTILFDRPPIEREGAADRYNGDEPMDPTSMTDPFAWAGDEEVFHDPDLSRGLPPSGYPRHPGPVPMPPYVDPRYYVTGH